MNSFILATVFSSNCEAITLVVRVCSLARHFAYALYTYYTFYTQHMCDCIIIQWISDASSAELILYVCEYMAIYLENL